VGGVEESERVDMCESRVEVRDFAKSERGGVGTGDLVEGMESVDPVCTDSKDVSRLSVSAR